MDSEQRSQHHLSSWPADSPYVARTRAYAFVVDENGNPIELGSGRFAKCFLGEEWWVDSTANYRRRVAIKVLQRGVSDQDRDRFQLEKKILERVQPHRHVVALLASGYNDSEAFIPAPLRSRLSNDFVVLELLDMSLEERLKGTHNRRDNLLALTAQERLMAALDYVVPIASAVEYTHLERNVSHRDIKPANILIKLPNPELAGDQLQVKLADFNVGKVHQPDFDPEITRIQSVPGTLYFQSPEQEMNSIELLVNVTQGSPEIEYFEDFYIDIHQNDRFSLYNRGESYPIKSADRARKRLLLGEPYAQASEVGVRAKVTKAVGRPADIYSLGALLYYLASGACANPKTLYDAFRNFLEYDKDDETNTVTSYIQHEYSKVQNLRAPKADDASKVQLAPQDRFFSYKHLLDGAGELIDQGVMLIVAKAMIRNKADSYCASWDLGTRGISDMVKDLLALYPHSGIQVTRGRDQLVAQTPKAGGFKGFWQRLFGG